MVPSSLLVLDLRPETTIQLLFLPDHTGVDNHWSPGVGLVRTYINAEQLSIAGEFLAFRAEERITTSGENAPSGEFSC